MDHILDLKPIERGPFGPPHQEECMKIQSTRSNRILFLILFVVLGMDLAGRLDRPTASAFQSVDMASTKASEEECAELIKSGIESDAKEAGCVLNYSGVRVEARVTKVTNKAKKLDWSTPTNIPEKPKDKDCADIKDAKEKASCVDDNRKAQEKYLQDLKRSQNAGKDKGDEKFQVDIVTVIDDCDECSANVSYTVARSESPLGISRTIRAKADEQYKAANDKKKKVKADANAAIALQKDIESCVKTSDGKAYKNSQAQLECQVSRLKDAEEENDQRKIFAEIKGKLRQKIERGNETERAEAIAMADELAANEALPKEIQNTAKTLGVAGRYQDQILKISQNLTVAPQNSQARNQLLQQLNSVQMQMNRELGGATQWVQRNGGASSDFGNELAYWTGSLSTSISLAQTRPQALLDSHGYFGREQLGMDINQYNRTLRGLPGDPLVSSASDFNGLVGSTNSYVQNQIRQMNNSVNQFQGQNGQRYTPGIPAPGAQANNGNFINNNGQPQYNQNGQPQYNSNQNYNQYNLNNGQPTNQQRTNSGGYRPR